MRHLLAFVLMFCLVGVAAAADLGNQAPTKTGPVIQDQVADREGGETIETATPIPGLPFSDSGATCDNINDYDEVCPFSGSTSPDVVYSFVGGGQFVNIDLCGSGYDTKVYVYDANGGLVACNDDFYGFGDPCGSYVSYLENILFAAGMTYYIVVDGYFGACGSYVIDITENVPCVLNCVGEPEGEPTLMDEYVDLYNGGCNTDGVFPFQSLFGDANEHLTFCGISGWYSFGGSAYRDTDWFEVIIGANGYIEASVDAEFPVYLFELGPQDCATVGVLQQVTGGDCSPSPSLTVFGTPGDIVWLWVGPTAFSGPVYEFDYILTVDGLLSGIAVEPSTWSDVRGLYR